MNGETNHSSYFPFFAQINGIVCVVVGGGQVACRRARALAQAGAIVTMVAPQIHESVPGVHTVLRDFREEDIEQAAIVVAATDNSDLNALIADLAKQRGKWVNVADDPQAGNVIFPALVRRGRLTLAVCTSGASPALAQQIRERLEKEYGPEFQELTDLLFQLREEWEPQAAAAGLSSSERGAAWHAVIELPLLDLLRQGKQSEAKQLARNVLESFLIKRPR